MESRPKAGFQETHGDSGFGPSRRNQMVVLRRVRIGRCTRLAVTLVISLFSGAASQYEVLDSVKDAKRFDANNVTVIGLFGSKSADGYR
jgi:hypothetical protein